MTYEERHQYQELRQRLDALRASVDQGEPEAPVTRAEIRELLLVVEAAVERMSPERWDRALEAVAGEAARRADVMAARRS